MEIYVSKKGNWQQICKNNFFNKNKSNENFL